MGKLNDFMSQDWLNEMIAEAEASILQEHGHAGCDPYGAARSKGSKPGKVKRFVASKSPWASFSDFVCRTMIQDVQGGESYADNVYGALEAGFRGFKGGVPVARGLNSLCVANKEWFFKYIFASERMHVESNYSLNIAFAVKYFASAPNYPQIPRRDFSLEEALGTNDPYFVAMALWSACARSAMEQGVSRKQAFASTETPLVICSRVTKGTIYGFGGDSESGISEEAEIKLKAYPKGKIERVFILAPKGSGLGRKASSADRTTYCLGRHLIVRTKPLAWFYGGQGELILHPKTNLKLADKRLVLSTKKVDRVPRGREWRRLV